MNAYWNNGMRFESEDKAFKIQITSITEEVYVDTSELSSMLDFGKDIFMKHCAIEKIASQKLIFNGKYRDCITPKGASFLNNNHTVQTINKYWY